MRTGHKPTEPQCVLGRFSRASADAEEIKREGWQELEIFVMPLDDPRLGWIEKQVIAQLGDRVYGKRKA